MVVSGLVRSISVPVGGVVAVLWSWLVQTIELSWWSHEQARFKDKKQSECEGENGVL